MSLLIGPIALLLVGGIIYIVILCESDEPLKWPPFVGVFSHPAPPLGTITLIMILRELFRPYRFFKGQESQVVIDTIVGRIQHMSNHVDLLYIWNVVDSYYPLVAQIDRKDKKQETFTIVLTRPALFFFRAWLKQVHGSVTDEEAQFLFLCRLYTILIEVEHRLTLLYRLRPIEETVLLEEGILDEEEEETFLTTEYKPSSSPSEDTTLQIERRNEMQEAMNRGECETCVRAAMLALGRVFALAQENGQHITQASFVGKEDMQLIRTEWDLLLSKSVGHEGWLRKAGLLSPENLLPMSQAHTETALSAWIENNWQHLTQKG